MFNSESERIAFVRTVAPIIWGLVLTQLAGWGIDFDTAVAEYLGVSEALVNGVATGAGAIILWVLARAYPKHLERLLLWIPVGDYAYTQGEDLVVPSGRVVKAAEVINIPAGGVTAVDQFTTTFLARQPSEHALRAAATRLLDAAEQV